MAGETFQLEEAHVQQYTSNVRLLLQDMGKSLRNYCEPGDYAGSKGGQAVQQFGETEPHINLPRFSDTPTDSVPQSQVWVFPQVYEWFTLVERTDELKSLIDLQGPFTKAGTAGMSRAEDRIVINAHFAAAKIGENGGNNENFDSANQTVAVDVGAKSATGMNVAKLKRAKKKLEAAEVDFDMEEVFCGITAQQEEDLLNDVEVINRDYANTAGRPILNANGNVVQYLGFRFVRKEGWLTDTNGYRRCPIWTKSGMHFGGWEEVTPDIGPRRDKRGATQIHLRAMGGATRTENKRVIEVKCAE